MSTNTSTSSQSFTRERSIIIRTTFPRQFMILELAKQFFSVRVEKSTDFSKSVIFISHT
jgi:hypothetical protein